MHGATENRGMRHFLHRLHSELKRAEASSRASRGLHAAAALTVAALFATFLWSFAGSFSPTDRLQNLQKKSEGFALRTWELHGLSCSQGSCKALQPSAALGPIELPLSAGAFANRIRPLFAQTSGQLPLTHLELVHTLTPEIEHVVSTRLENEKVTFWNLVLPQSVQYSVSLTAPLATQNQSTSPFYGIGTTAVFALTSRSLLSERRISLRFWIHDLDQMGPLTLPVTLSTGAGTTDVLALPENTRHAFLLSRALDLIVAVFVLCLSLVLDANPIIRALSWLVTARAFRHGLSMADQVGWLGSDMGILRSALVVAANAFVVWTMIHLAHIWMFAQFGNRQATPKVIKRVHAAAQILGQAAVGAALLHPGFLYGLDGWADLVGALLACCLFAATFSHTKFVQVRQKKERGRERPADSQQVDQIWEQAETHPPWALGVLKALLAAHALVNLGDLMAVLGGEVKDTSDPMHLVFLPGVTFLSVLSIGSMARQVHRFAQRYRKQVEVENEVNIAHHIQMRALPPFRGQIGSARWRCFHRAGTTLAGDWYGLQHICANAGTNASGTVHFDSGDASQASGLLCFALFDATGHGIQAALATAAIHSQWVLWCSQADLALSPTHPGSSARSDVCEKVLLDFAHRMDETLTAIGKGETATACIGIIDLITGRTVLANCGHPAPILQKTRFPASCSLLRARGDLMGGLAHRSPTWSRPQTPERKNHEAVPSEKLAPLAAGPVVTGSTPPRTRTRTLCTFNLEAGDTLMLFTDGVQIASRSAGAWIKEQITAARAGQPLDLRMWASARQARKRMHQEPDVVDDITLFALHWEPSAATPHHPLDKSS